MVRARWTTLLVSCLLPATLGLVATASAASPSPDATATGEVADDPALASFYEQSPAWEDCGGGIIDCTTVDVPIDYADPDAGTVGIRVNRVQALDESQGTIFLNPGGPGESGTEFLVPFGTLVEQTLLPSFDLVGFDPRGVASSDPITCLDTAGLDAFLAADLTPDEDEAGPTLEATGAACAANAVPLVAHMSTVETARDLDILRAVLGQEHLDYYGASYGTFLGATYAALFPENVGSMVLDGAYDGTLSVPQIRLGQTEGFERALEDYADGCIDSGDCPLGSTREEVLAAVGAVLEEVDARPLPTDDPDRPLTQQLAFWGIISKMYSEESWPVLTQALGLARDGDGSALRQFADQYLHRDIDGYRDDIFAANVAVACLDDGLVAGGDVPPVEAFLDQSPTLGAILHGRAVLTCDVWPFQPGFSAPDYGASGAAPIVVIGTTRDPATPYEWSQAFADRIESGVLITRDGDGHTGYNKGNACVDDAVNAYFLEGTVPEDGLEC